MSKSKVVGKNKTVAEVPQDMPSRKLEVVNVPLADLQLWDKNPRKTDAAAKKLAKLIAVHGFNSPLICTPDNVIRKGNTSYKAAEILGMQEVPVIYIEFPTEEQATMYAIADNRASEFSEWDPGLLAELLGEKSSIPLPAMAELTGFSQPEIAGLRDMRIEFVSQDLRDAAEAFEGKEGKTGKPEKLWAWLLVPSSHELKRITEKLGRGGKNTELDYSKVAEAIGVQHGPVCDECGGGGHAGKVKYAGAHMCEKCHGSGYAPTNPRSVKRVN